MSSLDLCANVTLHMPLAWSAVALNTRTDCLVLSCQGTLTGLLARSSKGQERLLYVITCLHSMSVLSKLPFRHLSLFRS